MQIVYCIHMPANHTHTLHVSTCNPDHVLLPRLWVLGAELCCPRKEHRFLIHKNVSHRLLAALFTNEWINSVFLAIILSLNHVLLCLTQKKGNSSMKESTEADLCSVHVVLVIQTSIKLSSWLHQLWFSSKVWATVNSSICVMEGTRWKPLVYSIT